MFAKFNLILNTSNDKFIYDDRSLHRWLGEDCKKGRDVSFVSVRFFPKNLCLNAHADVLVTSRLAFCCRFFWHKSRVMEAIYICRGGHRSDCSFSGSIKRTLDGFLSSPTAASRRCKKAMNQTWRLLSQHARKKAAEAIVSEISVKMIDYAVYKFRTMFRQRHDAGSAERWADLPADRTSCECEAATYLPSNV